MSDSDQTALQGEEGLAPDEIPNIYPEDLKRLGIPWCPEHLRRKIKRGEFPPPYYISPRKPSWTPKIINRYLRQKMGLPIPPTSSGPGAPHS
jgi:hypothetical protein